MPIGRVWAVASPAPLTVSTINVNGIRAAVKQRSTDNLGLLPWLKETEADVVCLQETRADDEQLSDALAPALADGWNLASAVPHVKGRNGVAVLSRHPIEAARLLVSDEFEAHGRYLEVDTAGVTVASVYVPTGEAETERQLEKERFMATIAARMAELLEHDAVLCGDWNIAHTENDIKNWKGNVKKAGFLPSERAWLTELLGTGWVDVVRVLHPDVAGPYSWWSWRGKAFDNDAGWRIDYHLASPTLAVKATSARVDRAELYALRWSDHSPVTVCYG
ncbi:exodeoxyribonuclease III Xth [Mycolicibacterium farcinogenes]|uniref:Exodeoxyribonuclease III Xth n=2 Tax=Mycolicibacterium TaxID=1866885 RepID=A0A378W4M6_9MYCO|nr:exodeoxyribonuclease III Xth [Mycolicibacterium farcinogenes]CQD05798.1 exodeoxyribonuclease III Xth [Mycolicibacterium conceptionense]SUA27352.1 exodeoxyribonuclease III Xth [Mycolicibacterium senegalense]